MEPRENQILPPFQLLHIKGCKHTHVHTNPLTDVVHHPELHVKTPTNSHYLNNVCLCFVAYKNTKNTYL